MRLLVTALLALTLVAGCGNTGSSPDPSAADATSPTTRTTLPPKAPPPTDLPTLPSDLAGLPMGLPGDIDDATRLALTAVLENLRVHAFASAIFTADGHAIAWSGHYAAGPDALMAFFFNRRVASLAPLLSDAPMLLIPRSRTDWYDVYVFRVANHFLAIGMDQDKEVPGRLAPSLREIESILAEP